MRVTPFIIYDRVLNDFRRSFEDLGSVYDQISTGKKYSKPSDNVLDLAKSQDYKISIRGNEQYLKNIDDAMGKLAYTEGLMEGIGNSLTRLEELALKAANGTETAESRASVAEEVRNVREYMLSVANNQYQNKYLFSGYKTTTPSFDAAGNYQGDSNIKRVLVDNNTYVDENIPGSQVFDNFDGQGNMFEMMDNLYNALLSNDVDGPTGIRSAIDRLDAANIHITNTRADLGSRLNSIDSLKNRVDYNTLILQGQLSGSEDADYAESISQLAQSETALQAMRESAGRIINQTLMDFLS